MRLLASSMALGAALILALVASPLRAQEQPAAGAPPPAATTQTPPPEAQAPPPEAQPDHAPNPMRQAKRLARKLALTPEQQSEIEPILAARQQQIQSIRADATLTPKEQKISVRGIFEDSDGRIKAILNPAQRQLYAQMKQEQRARRQQRKDRQRDVPPPPTANPQ